MNPNFDPRHQSRTITEGADKTANWRNEVPKMRR